MTNIMTRLPRHVLFRNTRSTGRDQTLDKICSEPDAIYTVLGKMNVNYEILRTSTPTHLSAKRQNRIKRARFRNTPANAHKALNPHSYPIQSNPIHFPPTPQNVTEPRQPAIKPRLRHKTHYTRINHHHDRAEVQTKNHSQLQIHNSNNITTPTPGPALLNSGGLHSRKFTTSSN